MNGDNIKKKTNWIKDNYGWIKWVIGIVWSLFIAYGTYQKMKWDIEDMKKDMEVANIREMRIAIEDIQKTNDNINTQLNIILNHLLNQ